MKFPFVKSSSKSNKSDDVVGQDANFMCKECTMTFRSRESLEKHKNKANHHGGRIYFGKGEK